MKGDALNSLFIRMERMVKKPRKAQAAHKKNINTWVRIKLK
jgi:hypothetical protein